MNANAQMCERVQVCLSVKAGKLGIKIILYFTTQINPI
jgi:hypothetical protein